MSCALGCEVKNDMSGQSNNCLRVCNVKMKKNYQGGNAPHFCELFSMGRCMSHVWVGRSNTHVSGQSNNCLRVCNVKMKKNSTGAETGHISMHVWVTGP